MAWYDALAMNKVVDRLWLGNYFNASKLAEDNWPGITAVLNVSGLSGYVEHPDITYKHIFFEDGKDIPKECFWACMEFLKEMYDRGETIYVHCAAGISRSPTIVASFMTHHLGWEFDSALLWVHKVRKEVNPATAVKTSAKKHLKVYPYDGSYGAPVEPDTFIWMDAERAAQAHPDLNCPLRKFFLIANKLGDMENVPRHTIPCTCTH